MKAVIIVLAMVLAGCSTLNDYGIGGPPLIMCHAGRAYIDDRIVGPDAARLSVVRRTADADALCKGAP